MYKSTVESDSTHRRWLSCRKDHGNRFCGPVCSIRHSEPHTSDTETLQHHKHTIICGTKQMGNAADRENNIMVCHKVVHLHQPYSTFTPTTSRSTMEAGASSTQTIYVSRPSTNHSSRFKRQLKMHWIT